MAGRPSTRNAAGTQREHPAAAVPVLERHLADVDPTTAPQNPLRRVLDDECRARRGPRGSRACARPGCRRRRTRRGSRGCGRRSAGRCRAAGHRAVLPRRAATRGRTDTPGVAVTSNYPPCPVSAGPQACHPARPLVSLTPCPAPPRPSPCGPRPGWPVPRHPTTCSTRSAPWAQTHDVVAADADTAHAHRCSAPGEPAGSVTFLLAALRRARPARPGRVVLPAPGDLRGLPGPGRSAGRRWRPGEGVLFADAGLGHRARRGGRSPTAVLRWTVYPVADPGPAPEYVALDQAERDLRDQVRQSASVLTSLGVARHRPGVREEIAAKLRGRSGRRRAGAAHVAGRRRYGRGSGGDSAARVGLTGGGVGRPECWPAWPAGPLDRAARGGSRARRASGRGQRGLTLGRGQQRRRQRRWAADCPGRAGGGRTTAKVLSGGGTTSLVIARGNSGGGNARPGRRPARAGRQVCQVRCSAREGEPTPARLSCRLGCPVWMSSASTSLSETALIPPGLGGASSAAQVMFGAAGRIRG